MSITAYKVEAVGHDRTGEDYGYVNIMYRYGSRQPCPRPDQCEKMEAIFWSVGSIVPILWLLELRNIWVYAFWTEPSVHLMNRLWGMPSPSIQIPLTTLHWKTMRNF